MSADASASPAPTGCCGRVDGASAGRRIYFEILLRRACGQEACPPREKTDLSVAEQLLNHSILAACAVGRGPRHCALQRGMTHILKAAPLPFEPRFGTAVVVDLDGEFCAASLREWRRMWASHSPLHNSGPTAATHCQRARHSQSTRDLIQTAPQQRPHRSHAWPPGAPHAIHACAATLAEAATTSKAKYCCTFWSTRRRRERLEMNAIHTTRPVRDRTGSRTSGCRSIWCSFPPNSSSVPRYGSRRRPATHT
eukprot:7377909-Prymnesium_polylepis.1